jgi:DNA repair exonuclease SbcCD ATPase subunit
MYSQDEMDPSEVKKRNLARKKVQDEMDGLRMQVRELRKKEESGHKVEQDLEACLGYIKVLKKELDMIKEGSHATFLSAKKYISPKFNYGSKKEELLSQIKCIAKEIKEAEKNLAGGGYTPEERQSIQERLMDYKTKHQEALLELKAIEQFNHTRFLEQKAVLRNTSIDETPSQATKEGHKHNLKKKSDATEFPKQEPNREQYNNFDPPPMI